MNKIITYGIEPDGTVISRYTGPAGTEIASTDGGIVLARFPIHQYFRERDVMYGQVRWTKGFGNTHGVAPIDLEVRNEHRKFWGFKPLKK